MSASERRRRRVPPVAHASALRPRLWLRPARRLTAFAACHRDVGPVDAVEVEHHRLRVLKLMDVGVPAGPGDRLDPERRVDLRSPALPPEGLWLEARNAVFAVPPPPLMGLLVVETCRKVLPFICVPWSEVWSASWRTLLGS